MYRFTDHFLVPVGVSMYADSAVFCPIDTHPPIYPNPVPGEKVAKVAKVAKSLDLGI